MKPKELRIRGIQILGKENRSEQKIIRAYPEVREGQIVMVRVYASPEPQPWHQIPVGFTHEYD